MVVCRAGEISLVRWSASLFEDVDFMEMERRWRTLGRHFLLTRFSWLPSDFAGFLRLRTGQSP